MKGDDGRSTRSTRDVKVGAQAEWTRAWSGRYGRPSSRRLRPGGKSPAKLAVLFGALLGLLIAPLAIAQGEGSGGDPQATAAGTGDVLREGIRNPQRSASRRETEFIGFLRATRAAKGGYTTRQSNLSGSGGGAIYGCRSGPGGTPANQQPCLRANNLRTGLAFEFNATDGNVGGVISKGNLEGVHADAVPFVTNMAGMVENLNAQRVGNLTVEQILTRPAGGDLTGNYPNPAIAGGAVSHDKLSSDARPRWAIISGADGAIARSRGTTASDRIVTGVYEVIFDRDVTECSYLVQMGGINLETPVGIASAARRSGKANGVYVETRSEAGAAADRSFHLQVLC